MFPGYVGRQDEKTTETLYVRDRIGTVPRFYFTN